MKQLNWIERQDAMKELNIIATMKGSGYPMNDRPPVIEPEDIKPGKLKPHTMIKVTLQDEEKKAKEKPFPIYYNRLYWLQTRLDIIEERMRVCKKEAANVLLDSWVAVVKEIEKLNK